jgi:hypothetical protein
MLKQQWPILLFPLGYLKEVIQKKEEIRDHSVPVWSYLNRILVGKQITPDTSRRMLVLFREGHAKQVPHQASLKKKQ